jgi:hypothetical protein
VVQGCARGDHGQEKPPESEARWNSQGNACRADDHALLQELAPADALADAESPQDADLPGAYLEHGGEPVERDEEGGDQAHSRRPRQ